MCVHFLLTFHPSLPPPTHLPAQTQSSLGPKDGFTCKLSIYLCFDGSLCYALLATVRQSCAAGGHCNAIARESILYNLY